MTHDEFIRPPFNFVYGKAKSLGELVNDLKAEDLERRKEREREGAL
jgi:hypothetical protein